MPTGLPTVIVAEPPAKWWMASRIIIVNAVALALAAAELQLGLLRPLLGDHVYLVLAFALPVINAALRANTSRPLALRRPNRADATGPAAGPAVDPTTNPKR